MTTSTIIQPAIINTDDPDILGYLVDNGYLHPEVYETHTAVLDTENLLDLFMELPHSERTLGIRKLMDVLEDLVYEHHIPEVIFYEVLDCISPYLKEPGNQERYLRSSLFK